MKHHRLITRKPVIAQTNLQAKLDFAYAAYQSIVDVIFTKGST